MWHCVCDKTNWKLITKLFYVLIIFVKCNVKKPPCLGENLRNPCAHTLEEESIYINVPHNEGRCLLKLLIQSICLLQTRLCIFYYVLTTKICLLFILYKIKYFNHKKIGIFISTMPLRISLPHEGTGFSSFITFFPV